MGHPDIELALVLDRGAPRPPCYRCAPGRRDEINLVSAKPAEDLDRLRIQGAWDRALDDGRMVVIVVVPDGDEYRFDRVEGLDRWCRISPNSTGSIPPSPTDVPNKEFSNTDLLKPKFWDSRAGHLARVLRERSGIRQGNDDGRSRG